jgi:O-antigen ligase
MNPTECRLASGNSATSRFAEMAQRNTSPNHSALARMADYSAIGVAAALPWSTSATGILIGLWLIALFPTLDFSTIRREFLTLAGGLPVLLCVLAVMGMMWAHVPWIDRFAGLGGFYKLVAIPIILTHFRRSDKATWLLAAFLISCSLLLILSYGLALWPGLTWRGARSPGVPVKEYLAQSTEFVICFFVLLAIGFRLVRDRPLVSVGAFVVAASFLVNGFYIASSRTALVVTAVLLFVFAFRQWEWKKAGAALLAAITCAFFVWQTSTYLSTELGLVSGEVQRYLSENARTRSGERLEYWQKSISFIGDAPILGHGTGSIRELFRQAAGQSGASALISDNPHNQTLTIAIQLGIAGVALLYAMWMGHLRLFLGTNLPAWVGLVIVVQNLVSSLFNSHLFDFTHGWIYVVGVGVAGGTVLRCQDNAKGPNPSYATGLNLSENRLRSEDRLPRR